MRLLAPFVAGMLFAFAASEAQTPPTFSAKEIGLRDQAYMSGWFINPQPIPVATQPIKKLQPLLATRVFPYKAYVLDDPITLSNPGYAAAAGTHLVGVIAHYPVACTQENIGKTATQTLLLKSGTVRLCLVDSNNDGSFDKSFTTKRISIGPIPADAMAITPVKYREIERTTSAYASNLWLYLRHAKKSTVQIGYHSHKDNRIKDGLINILLDEALFYEFKVKSLPHDFRLFGTVYRIEEMGDDTARISIVSQQKLAPIHLGEACCL